MSARILLSRMTRWPVIGCILIFFVACQPDTALDAPNERIARADARLTKIRLESQKAVARSKEKILAVYEATGIAVASADGAEATLEDAKLELETLVEEFATYRHAYRSKLRTDLLEIAFPEMTLSGGQQLTQFRVRNIENAMVSYSSSEKIGRMPLVELPRPIVEFLRLAEEAKDLEAFPELIPRRESDIDLDAEAALALKDTENFLENSGPDAEQQKIRNAKAKLKTIYEDREKELKSMLDSLDTARVSLSAKRRRHQDYNEYHRTNVRDSAIASLSRSIAKIDQRSRSVYEKINVLRDLMQKNR